MIRKEPKQPYKGLKRTPMKRVAFVSTRKIVNGKKVKTKPQKISFLTKTPPKKRTSLKIRIDPLDSLTSEYVRKRSKGFCERCGKYYGWDKLQACHFHSRRKVSVRYDVDNLCACDFGCHQWLDGNPMEKVEFFRSRLGQEKFDMLNSRARITFPRPDRKIIELYLKSKIAELPQ
jgi:hypothetical protein